VEVSFIQRFGGKLNFHPHFHFCIADGVFGKEDGQLYFLEANLSLTEIKATEKRIAKRVLKLFKKNRWSDQTKIERLLDSENTGFSLNANVKVDSFDREGLERLLRYCARPCFASENLKLNYTEVNSKIGILALRKPRGWQIVSRLILLILTDLRSASRENFLFAKNRFLSSLRYITG
jgi:Putative transposase